MFTIKFYQDNGRQVIKAAESFTILHGNHGEAEITLHQKNPTESCRIDIADPHNHREEGWPPVFQKAIIENAAGKTTQIVALRPVDSATPNGPFPPAPMRATTADGKPWAA